MRDENIEGSFISREVFVGQEVMAMEGLEYFGTYAKIHLITVD